jgi:ABC-type Fe3+ transport system substrate-binding protein
MPEGQRYSNDKLEDAMLRIAFHLLTLFLLVATPAGAQTTQELYAKAKEEKRLVLWAGGPAAPWDARAKAFQAVYPGIEIKVEGGFSNVLVPKMDQQMKDNQLEVDLTVLQTLQDFRRWKKEGVLLSFKPEGFDTIDQTFKDSDGQYVAISAAMVAYAYNTNLVKKEDVPKSALDFLKPQFQGKIVTAYPADDDITLYQFYTIVQRYGWSFMDRYMANKPNFIQGHLGVSRSISSGQNAVSFDMIVSGTLGEKNQGQPTELAFPELDPVVIWGQSAAIFKAAPHPNAAKLFLTWMLAKEQQARLGTWSVRADVPPPAGLKPLFSHNVANNYMDFVSDEKQLDDLRKRFEKYTGPVVNAGGVR